MSDFRHLIQSEAKNIRELRASIYDTLEKRNRSDHAWKDWSQACKRFHGYKSLIQHWLELTEEGGFHSDKQLKDFAITYLEMDPRYFRSGYIKERLLERLKTRNLSAMESNRLAAVLIDAIQRRGGREFRRYCRLAATLQHPQVIEEAQRQTENSDGRLASRAHMMLRYMRFGSAAALHESN